MAGGRQVSLIHKITVAALTVAVLQVTAAILTITTTLKGTKK